MKPPLTPGLVLGNSPKKCVFNKKQQLYTLPENQQFVPGKMDGWKMTHVLVDKRTFSGDMRVDFQGRLNITNSSKDDLQNSNKTQLPGTSKQFPEVLMIWYMTCDFGSRCGWQGIFFLLGGEDGPIHIKHLEPFRMSIGYSPATT